MGLFAIGDMATRSGYNTQILHLGVEKIKDSSFSLRDYLSDTKPKIIGLSLHWHFQSYDVMQLAKKIRSFYPDSFIVLGGFTASYFYEEIMENFDCIDAIIRGDGELPFLHLTDKVASQDQDLSGVANLVWRDGGKIRCNSLSYVAKDEDLDKLNFTNLGLLKNYQLYRDISTLRLFWIKGLSRRMNLALCYPRYKGFPLSISRGCPVNCAYCGGGRNAQKLINGRTGVSVRSVGKVIESIRELKRFGYDTIHINYLPLSSKPKYFEELFSGIRSEGIKINCIMECWAFPPETVINEYKDTFTDHRFSMVVSPETGSEKIRKAYKGFYFSNNELFKFLALTKKSGISVSLFFTLGLPGETLKDIKATLDFQRELSGKFGRHISFQNETVEIDPASPAYEEPEQWGVCKSNLSFKDYFDTHSSKNKIPFSSFEPTYYIQNFSDAPALKGKMSLNLFRKLIRTTICREFCPLSNFLLIKLKIKHGCLFSKAVNLLSRVCCNIISFYWRCIIVNYKI